MPDPSAVFTIHGPSARRGFRFLDELPLYGNGFFPITERKTRYASPDPIVWFPMETGPATWDRLMEASGCREMPAYPPIVVLSLYEPRYIWGKSTYTLYQWLLDLYSPFVPMEHEFLYSEELPNYFKPIPWPRGRELTRTTGLRTVLKPPNLKPLITFAASKPHVVPVPAQAPTPDTENPVRGRSGSTLSERNRRPPKVLNAHWRIAGRRRD